MKEEYIPMKFHSRRKDCFQIFRSRNEQIADHNVDLLVDSTYKNHPGLKIVTMIVFKIVEKLPHQFNPHDATTILPHVVDLGNKLIFSKFFVSRTRPKQSKISNRIELIVQDEGIIICVTISSAFDSRSVPLCDFDRHESL